ncbi:putative Aluminum-activated malate transporter 9 [Cocos nucifera]|nr:putative Aluminum-activated malate transporter 9 [Cocos nucifera]
MWGKAWEMVVKGWNFVDPRKVIFGIKVGLALTLTSFIMFLREISINLSKHSFWAILTIIFVFIFEFTMLCTMMN